MGIVLSGRVKYGKIEIGDRLSLGPFNGNFYEITIKSIHDNFKNNVKFLENGNSGCINIKFINNKKEVKDLKIKNYMVCIKNPKCIREFNAEITILNHPTTIKKNYEPFIHCGSIRQSAKICDIGDKILRTGDKSIVKFRFLFRPEFLELNQKILFREGKTKGIGRVTKLIK